MATHIVFRETGQDVDLEQVDLAAKKTASGEDYTRINPKGSVPALKLDDGQTLTESAVILQYVADQAPDAALAPQAGSMERYRLMEALNYVASEIHKSVGALFNPDMTTEWKDGQLALIAKRFDYLTRKLDGEQFFLGDEFSLADAYLFTVLNWHNVLDLDMSRWPALTDYVSRIASRPAVQDAMKAEGLTG